MDSTTILEKTAKGQDELTSRQNKLPSRCRALLIMVDGKRSVRDIANTPEGEQLLQALLDDGFLALSASSPAPSAAAPAPDGLAKIDWESIRQSFS